MKPTFPKPEAARRRAIMSQHDLVKEDLLRPELSAPLVLAPAAQGVNLVDWAGNNKPLIESRLAKHGSVLFRHFNIRSVEEFERFMRVLCGELLDYSYRSTPRTQISGRIYTSTEYPAHQTIPLHNEMSYSRNWPMLLGFCCLEPSVEGGQTPVADSRKVFQRISRDVSERFARKRVMYVRNYGNALDLPWQDVFQTNDRWSVEEYCRQADIGFEWKGEERLRTWQVCQAVAKHPRTGEMVWFNQAHLFHVSSLEPELQQALRTSADEEPPRNAFYGDGSDIEESVLEEIRAAYQNEAVVFAWEKGDILILDNMLAAHGRKPYSGSRQIVVGMAQSFSEPVGVND